MLVFDWCLCYVVGEVLFVIFCVGYVDYSSWDMVWLCIDWNGYGFDVFVIDVNLVCICVLFCMDVLLCFDQWLYLVFVWDEDQGVCLFIDGCEVVCVQVIGDYDVVLDQFGLVGWVMVLYQVQSCYNFLCGSDFQYIWVYDCMLDVLVVVVLVCGCELVSVVGVVDGMCVWCYCFGWDGVVFLVVVVGGICICKIEFVDICDLKVWMWKVIDGIVEIIWLGVYNCLCLFGCNDYFQFLDWNIYVEGGQYLDLILLVIEMVNWVEICGVVFGIFFYGFDVEYVIDVLVMCLCGVVCSVDNIVVQCGGVLCFSNVEQEILIQEIWVYYVSEGGELEGMVKQIYIIDSYVLFDYINLDVLCCYIDGCFLVVECSMVMVLLKGVGFCCWDVGILFVYSWFIVYVLIFFGVGDVFVNQLLICSWVYSWENMYDGLDGVVIDFFVFNLLFIYDGLILLNICIKDLIWLVCDMIDVLVLVLLGQKCMLWLDLCDCIFILDSLWLSIVLVVLCFDVDVFDGVQVWLVFKLCVEVLKEYVVDCFNQVCDNWGFLVEEYIMFKC